MDNPLSAIEGIVAKKLREDLGAEIERLKDSLYEINEQFCAQQGTIERFRAFVRAQKALDIAERDWRGPDDNPALHNASMARQDASEAITKEDMGE